MNQIMTIREKIFKYLLELYMITMSSSSSGAQSQSNPRIEAIMENLAMKSGICEIVDIFGPILTIELPPKLQAILKFLTSRIKIVT